MEPEQYPGLEMDADHRQQRREWLLQRITPLFLLALLALIALGLFGRGGPISKVEASAYDGSFRIEYDRFVRHHSPDMLRVNMQALSSTVSVKLDSEYLKQVEIERITPQPERVISEDGAVIFVFNARAAAHIYVTFHFVPETIGRLKGWVTVDDKPRRSFDQFVYL
jgi:hypothetical protein